MSHRAVRIRLQCLFEADDSWTCCVLAERH
jgi:hypothetical protein